MSAPLDLEGARAFVREQGAVFESGKGPLPRLVEAVAGEAIRGSWWGHRQGNHVFAVLTELYEDDDLVVLPLVGGKRTVVHARLWPALVRLSDEIGPERLAAVRSEHTASGKHVKVTTPFPDWVPEAVLREGAALSEDEARAALPAIVLQ